MCVTLHATENLCITYSWSCIPVGPPYLRFHRGNFNQSSIVLSVVHLTLPQHSMNCMGPLIQGFVFKSKYYTNVMVNKTEVELVEAADTKPWNMEGPTVSYTWIFHCGRVVTPTPCCSGVYGIHSQKKKNPRITGTCSVNHCCSRVNYIGSMCLGLVVNTQFEGHLSVV